MAGVYRKHRNSRNMMAAKIVKETFNPEIVAVKSPKGGTDDGSDIAVLVIMKTRGDRAERNWPVRSALGQVPAEKQIYVYTPAENRRYHKLEKFLEGVPKRDYVVM